LEEDFMALGQTLTATSLNESNATPEKAPEMD